MSGPRHVYIHVPFCARRCVYCDFSIAVRREVPARSFVRQVLREVDARALEGGTIDTLYLGGGTPSRLGAPAIAELLEKLARHWTLAPGAEVTIEANPEDVSGEAARAWVAAGVNRVSLGVQTFHGPSLAWMHRGHDEAQVRAAVEALQSAGVRNWSLDLIHALPARLGRDLRRDLDLALSLEPPHVSSYGLTVEPRTALGRQVERAQVAPAPEESHEGEFLLVHAALQGAGYDHYEVSNYARPGAASRHNRAYWSGRPYVGLGPSAHGFDGGNRRWNITAFAHWAREVERDRDPVEGSEELTPGQRALEDLYLDLRTDRGVLTSPSDDPIILPWMAAGWARRQGDRLLLTPTGWLRLDALVSALTDHRSRY